MVPVDEGSTDWLVAPEGPIASAAWGVTELELLAVQPLCLQYNEYYGASQSASAGQSSEVSDVRLHKLQVRLKAKLSRLDDPPLQCTEATIGNRHHHILQPPIPLPQTTVELTVLSRQTQVLVQQQYYLLQLLSQQQGAQAQQSQRVGEVFGRRHSMGQYSSDDDSWRVPVELCTSVPCQESGQVLDFLNLVVMIKSGNSALQQNQQQEKDVQQQVDDVAVGMQLHSIQSSSAAADSSPAPQQQVQLLAEVAVLLLPAVAHQEVQQLLLPAMVQEAQTITSSGDALQVEHIVWKHMQQLVHDLYAVDLLVRSLADPESEAAASRIAVEAAAAANAAQAATTGHTMLHGTSEQLTTPISASAAEAAAMSTQAALDSVADVLLFPILLPFLATHGLQHLLQLLLHSLPVVLQQKWQQQQHDRLQAYCGSTEQEVEAAGSADEVYEQTHDAAGSPGSAGEGVAGHTAAGTVGCSGLAVQGTQQQGSAMQHLRQTASAHEGKLQHHTLQEQQAEQETGVEYDIDSKPSAIGGSSMPGTTAVGQQARSAAASAAIATAAWYSPLTQFNAEEERRYLTWKHLSLLHLDQVGALFGFVYLIALLIRTVSEPNAMFHVIYVSLKVAPLVPLMLGYKLQFLRYRELWLWFVVPASLVGFLIFTSVQTFADPVTLLPQQSLSAFWKGRGELAVNAMIPFIQHMRVRVYIVYAVVDAAMSSWVFAQFFGWWEAAGRWGFAAVLSIALCWGFDLHMRRKFVAVEQRMRA